MGRDTSGARSPRPTPGPPALIHLAKWPRPSTNSSQPRLTAWLCLGISKTPAQGVTILHCFRRTVPGKTQVAAALGLHHLGNSRACVPSRQLQTTSEHYHPAPVQFILHRGQRLVVNGHSQSLQLTGLGKSCPFTCQEQPRLNYKRRVYSAHMKDAP